MSESETPAERWVRRPPWWIFLVAGLVVLAMASKTTEEVRGTSGWPSERVKALASAEHHSLRSCGKGAGIAQDVTWKSTQPPQGLPEVFETHNVCWKADESAVAVRQLHDDGTVKKVWLDPTTSYGDAAWITVSLGLFVFAGYYLLRGFKLVFRRYFWHD